MRGAPTFLSFYMSPARLTQNGKDRPPISASNHVILLLIYAHRQKFRIFFTSKRRGIEKCDFRDFGVGVLFFGYSLHHGRRHHGDRGDMYTHLRKVMGTGGTRKSESTHKTRSFRRQHHISVCMMQCSFPALNDSVLHINSFRLCTF